MAVTGDFIRLRLLQDRLKRMASGEARTAVLRELGNEAQRQMVASFTQQRDPYGRAWAPRKPPAAWAVKAFGLLQENHPLLDRTGRLLNSLRTKATSTALRITGLFYGAYHEHGTGNMAARLFVPRPDLGLGPMWGDAFLRVSSAVAKRFAGAV